MAEETARGVTLRDVAAADFIKEYAAHLRTQGRMKLPKNAELIKTAVARELAPTDDNWFYVRAASVARKIYLRQGLGIGGLRRIYGGGKTVGCRRAHFAPSSGGLIRHIVQQLETLNVIEKMEAKGGRRITRTGQQDLDRIAYKIVNGQ